MHRYKESELRLPDILRSVLGESFGRRVVGFKTEAGHDFNGVVLPESDEAIYINTEACK
jgi:hypothetical protein